MDHSLNLLKATSTVWKHDYPKQTKSLSPLPTKAGWDYDCRKFDSAHPGRNNRHWTVPRTTPWRRDFRRRSAASPGPSSFPLCPRCAHAPRHLLTRIYLVFKFAAGNSHAGIRGSFFFSPARRDSKVRENGVMVEKQEIEKRERQSGRKEKERAREKIKTKILHAWTTYAGEGGKARKSSGVESWWRADGILLRV